MGGLTPLHMAAELNSKEGVQIIKMLLTCLADANIRAVDDGAYLHLNLVDPLFSLTSFLSEQSVVFAQKRVQSDRNKKPSCR